MKLRKYNSDDCKTLATLFFDTVHTVNAKDYSLEQLNVWATGNIDLSAWDKSFLEHTTFVAVKNNIIVGFGDMDDSGYLDRLYVHHDFQRQGVAAKIVNELEKDAIAKGLTHFTTHASITARPFFERQGYITTRENIIIRNNIELVNFIMEKAL